IVAGTSISVVIRVWIAGSPVDELQLGIVRAVHPCGAAVLRFNRIKPPKPLAGFRLVRIDESPALVIATGHANYYSVVYYQWRRGGAQVLGHTADFGIPSHSPRL